MVFINIYIILQNLKLKMLKRICYQLLFKKIFVLIKFQNTNATIRPLIS